MSSNIIENGNVQVNSVEKIVQFLNISLLWLEFLFYEWNYLKYVLKFSGP